MLRDLIASDVEAICEINKEALGYAFSSEETASQLARLSKDPHHFLLVMRMMLVMNSLATFMQRIMNVSIPMQDLISWL